jgi:L-ascorbate metabolism protein UlaG (beta-lactamase superfamily)
VEDSELKIYKEGNTETEGHLPMQGLKRTFGISVSVIAVALFLFAPALFGQETSPDEIAVASAKYAPVFDKLEKWLESTPPPPLNGIERQQMLESLDEPFSLPDAKSLPCVKNYFDTRMKKFMEAFTATKVDSGVIVWKLYNHTAIVQTPKIRIAVDLFEGFDGVKWDHDLLKHLVDNVDVLLVTHSHADHVDPNTVKMFLDAGKPVVVPKAFFSVYHLKPKLTIIREGELKYNGATVRVFPSFQKDEEDNVYLITTDEGYTVMHLGDENEFDQAGHEWYKKLKTPLNIDILIPNIWCPNIATLLWRVHPKLIIPNHEHELSHTVSGRRSYDYVYKVLKTLGLPYVVPVWGEAVKYPLD